MSVMARDTDTGTRVVVACLDKGLTMTDTRYFRLAFTGSDGTETLVPAAPGKTMWHAVRAYHRHAGISDARGNGDGTTTYAVAEYPSLVADQTVTVNDDGIPFNAWLAAVDRRMAGLIGLCHSDIADWQWWDAWVACETPANAAREAIESDDTFAGFADI